jgi:hypothetical protein
MADIRISQLTPKGGNLDLTDEFAIAEWNGSSYVSRKITGAEVLAMTSGNIYDTNGSLTGNRIVDINGARIVFSDSGNEIFKVTANQVFFAGVSFPSTDGLLNQILVTDGAGTVTWRDTSYGLYAQTAASTPITTAPEASLIGTGVGVLTVPANQVKVGTSFHAKLGGKIDATGGGSRSEIIIRARSGGQILATTGVFDLDNASNQGWECELDFTFTQIGALGNIRTNGNFVYTKDGNRSVFGYIFQNTQQVDTTVNLTLDITAEWNVINGGDSIYSENMVVNKIF